MPISAGGKCVSKLLISTAVGREDPTRATIPFHIALNGAAAIGAECGVAFVGDATELIRPDVAETVRGVGVPPLKDLLDGLIAKDVAFYV